MRNNESWCENHLIPGAEQRLERDMQSAGIIR